METNAIQDRSRKGFTIVEVLVALTIFAIMLLGLYYSLIVSYKYSVANLLRDEAIRVAQEEMERLRIISFDNVTQNQLNPPRLIECNATDPQASIERQIRNSRFRFGKYFEVSIIDQNLKRVKLTVCWRYRGTKHQYSVESVIRKEE